MVYAGDVRAEPEPTALSRRRVLLGVGAGCLSAALPRSAVAEAPTTGQRVAEIEAASAALHAAKIDANDWRARVTAALAGVDAKQLRADLDLDWSTVAATVRAEGRYERRLEASELPGAPSPIHVRPKLFCLARDRAVLPHAHRHIVSVFVVLDGRARGRHFDRLEDAPDAILIRPSDDRILAPGEHKAITERDDNVHWFTAADAQVVLLNFSASVPANMRVHAGSAGRVYLDPDGERLEDGVIRAPRVSVSKLRAKYG